MNGENPVSAVLEAVEKALYFETVYIDPPCSAEVSPISTAGGSDRDPRRPWLVAVSGGVDSMVLLHSAKQVAVALGLGIEAIHVDHGLRITAARDREFVGRVCSQWGIPLTVCKLDWQKHVKGQVGLGGEAAARDLRYQSLIEVAKQRQAVGVLLAHHADDQVETVLLRLLRGASLSGLAGIRARVYRDGVHWIRPFLNFGKEVLQSYSKQFSIPYVEDESNQDERYLRNFLRLRVTPLLRERQPGLSKIVARTTGLIQEDDAYLDELAQAYVPMPSARDGSYRLSRQEFSRIPVPLQRRVVKIILYCLGSADWTARHVQAVLELAYNGGPSDALDLPGQVKIRCEYDEMVMGVRSVVAAEAPAEIEWSVATVQTLQWPGGAQALWEFTCLPWRPTNGFPQSLYELVIPRVPRLRIVPAQSHWRVLPMGLKGSKKLQDVMVDKKIPRTQRSTWPSVWYEDEVLWLPGILRTRQQLMCAELCSGWLITARPCRTSL
ncbi:tRNA lysidine(34) synthetase TilS [Alicyclobacillaceae bacterium I2511]|nr:tRNA lysidine(34) synthetase TilS [Alicyclobacillaceae bacterium I2511]